MENPRPFGLALGVAFVLAALLTACSDAVDVDAARSGPKIGVLLVNHGSHSKQWRQMLRDVEKAVKAEVLANGRVTGVKTAFMEYNEPSIAAQMKAFDSEGFDVVLVAYGDASFNQQWEELMDEVGRYVKANAEIDTVAYSWCGHLVDYSPEPTMQAIRRVFELEERVAVVPLLVAVDPAFQEDIIGKAVEESRPEGEILYRGDAILPDQGLHDWIIEITADAVARRS